MGMMLFLIESGTKNKMEGEIPIRFRLSNPFKAFLFSYVMILMIPILSGYISYTISIQEARASSLKIGMSILDQSKLIVDQRLGEVIRFTQQLNSDADLEDLMNRDDVQTDALQMYKLAQTLNHYASTNDFLANTYVYLKNSNTVIEPGSVFVRPNHFFAINHPTDEDYDHWIRNLKEGNEISGFSQAKPYTVKAVEKKFVAYTRTLPLENIESGTGTVVILIDEQKILNLLNGISDKIGGWSYIADSKGNIIASSGIVQSEAAKVNALRNEHVDQEARDNTIIFSMGSSELTNWYYVAGIPKSILMKSAHRIQSVTWLLTAATLLFGLLTSLFLAYRNTRPLYKITESIRAFLTQDGLPHGHGYDFIQGNISRILSHNRRLRDEIVLQEPILKDVFVKRLLNGEFNSATAIHAAASQANIHHLDEQGYVVLLQIRGYGTMESKEILNELFAARLVMKSTILEGMPEIMLTEWEFDKLVILIPIQPTSENNETEINRMLDLLHELNTQKYKLLFAISISSAFHSTGEIHRAYEEAKQALAYSNIIDSEGVFWFQDLPQDSVMYYYPLELEIRFTHAIRMGDYPEASAILNEIFHENFEARELSFDIYSLFISDLKTSLMKGFDIRGLVDSDKLKWINNQMAQLQASQGNEIIKNTIQQCLQSFCSLVEEQKNEAENKTVQMVMNYLDTHFKDPELSMNKMADAIGRPEKYLTQKFKEHTGEYIYIHLEKIRMDKARQLLLETDEKIESISEKCGYASPQSFRRAFKRYCGMPPHDYRQTVK